MTGWSMPSHVEADLGIVVSFGYRVPQRVIDAFPRGVLNLHPSLLPLYRGASPIQFSLLHGDRYTGVSLIDVHPTHIDGGHVLDQRIMVKMCV